jgi:hypothetical protein
MVRNILSIVAGIICSFIAIIAIESIAHILNPIPVDPHNAEFFRNYVRHDAPNALHILILSAYAIGSFTGGFVTVYISLHKKIVRAMTIGGLLMGIGIYNLILANHPSWVIVCAFFTFLPSSYLGGKRGKTITAKRHVSH